MGLNSHQRQQTQRIGTVNELGESVANANFEKAAGRLYDYTDAVENSKRSHIDFTDVVDRQTTPAVEDLTTATDAATQSAEESEAAFDALNRVVADAGDTTDDTSDAVGSLADAGEETARAMGRLQQQIFNVNKDLRDGKITAEEAEERIGLLIDAFNTFGHDGTLGVNAVISAVGTLADVLVDAEGHIGNLGTGLNGLVDLFSNPINFAANTIGEVFIGLARANEFGGPIGLPQGFFDDPVPGQAQVNPQNVVQNQQLAADQVHQAGIARNLNADDPLAQIEILRENDPGIFQRHGTRGFIEENFPDLVDVIYPQTTGASAQFNLYQRGQAIRAGAPTAGQTALVAAQAAEANSVAARDAAAAAALSDIPEPDLPPEIADPLADTPDPLTTFSFTRDERAALAPYLADVRDAEDAIEDLTEDSTPQEIADAYQDLVFAQTNLSSVTEGIIQAQQRKQGG